ncbi:response regulator [Thiothrix fructosivorans]|jgi:DNA-binding NarL/FixJ family response regulator|uniref:Response regulator transcription factor n=1 Tax=Thiothrix fructosivorans TaxID=111770 RepID=A0A8B0SNY5_9GAMM|nr:response regulator transcription factor [Thiothrix fructosivorans]MBO0612239.1 response regulator transcription factor [Thiothrix fructosivorans]QTX12270.1 response regulator transcription factor [Thiothrix fructosivorans]
MRVLIVDDHPLFREVLCLHVEACFPHVWILEAGSVQEALGVLTEYTDFSLILLDVSMPVEDGITGLRRIRAQVPDVPITMLSGIGDTALAHVAIANGANGYISKTVGGRDLKNALLLILQGETYISPAILVEVGLDAPPPTPPPLEDAANVPVAFGMTPRQLEVCRLMIAGLPNKAIARKLACAEGTVRLHVSAVLRALNVRNRTEAVQAVLRLGIDKI